MSWDRCISDLKRAGSGLATTLLQQMELLGWPEPYACTSLPTHVALLWKIDNREVELRINSQGQFILGSGLCTLPNELQPLLEWLITEGD